jgi:serine/threonine protein kinase
MSTSIPDFWRLIIESQLLPPAECQRLGQQFGYVKGAAVQGNARTLAEWLVSQNVISRYQSTILLAGRAGPFSYEEYKIYDRLDGGPLHGQFKAVHAITGQPVMLKFFAGDAVSDATRWSQTVTRALQQSRIVHPHWWRTYELVDQGQFRFAAVEDVAGQSLAQRLAQGPLPAAEACRIAYQLALALDRAHETGYVHGDVRPENIVIDRLGRAVLWNDASTAPVGIRTDASDALTLARADYAAPELGRPGAACSPLTDVYALGATLYHLLSGRAPFAGGGIAQKMQRHAAEGIQPLAPLGVPEPLEKAIAFMMAKNATVRFAKAQIAADALSPFIAKEDRQPKPAAALPTTPAYEQHLSRKPKPNPTPVRTAPANNVALGGATPVRVVPVAGVKVAPTIATGMAASASPTNFNFAGAPGATGDGAATPAGRAQKKKSLAKNMPLLIMIGGAAAFLLAIGGLIASGALSSPDEGTEVAEAAGENGATNVNPTSTNTSSAVTETGDGDGNAAESSGSDTVTPAGETGPSVQLVADDGKTLWAAPVDGKNIDMAYVPALAGVYIIARPSDILASDRGSEVLRALGPDFDAVRRRWEQSAGVTLDEVEQLVIGVHDNDSQMPRFTTTVRLKNAADMKARWNNPAAGPLPNTFSVGGQLAWLPPAAEGKTFVLGAAPDIEPLAKNESPTPRPQFDPYFAHLIKSSNDSQHVVALVDPHFLRTDGREMFSGAYAKLVDPIDWFFGDDVKGMASLHFGSDFYGELRLYARLQKRPDELKEEVRVKLDETPQQMENYVLSLNPPAYWKKAWFKFPQMITAVRSQMRLGVEDDQTVINFALPGVTAPNLIAATELSIASTPGAAASTGGPTTTPVATKPKPQTIEELLNAKIDIGFAQQSLEFAMRDLATAAREEYPELPFDFQIKVIGTDLQKEGITRNQQIRDINAKQVSVADVLTQFVRKGNPVTTVQNPNEIDQKLVWLVGPDPDDATKKIVLITTRVAAGEKKLTLPAVFVPK